MRAIKKGQSQKLTSSISFILLLNIFNFFALVLFLFYLITTDDFLISDTYCAMHRTKRRMRSQYDGVVVYGACKHDDLSLMSRAYMVEGKNFFFFFTIHCPLAAIHIPWHAHHPLLRINKFLKRRV